MSQTLKKFKPTIIYEVDDGNQDSFRRKSQEIEDFMLSVGYQIRPLDEAYPAIGWHVGHILAIPNKVTPYPALKKS